MRAQIKINISIDWLSGEFRALFRNRIPSLVEIRFFTVVHLRSMGCTELTVVTLVLLGSFGKIPHNYGFI